ncbi:MAG: dTMP kinase [Bacteroidota bacterium]|nr:dTMP kinase [Bacteroidota bacterium]
MFISFEGLDGSGKTTQANLLVETLKARHHAVDFIREPGGTDISERIREILLDKKHLGMNEVTELLLFSAARAQLVVQTIQPALKEQRFVVCDRYVDSTMAYQGYGRGLNLDAVRAINAAATFGVMPDVTFLIDISVEEIIERRKQSGTPIDRMESSGKMFYEKVRRGYLATAKEEPQRFVVVDGAQSIEAIKKIIWEEVEKRTRKQKAEMK